MRKNRERRDCRHFFSELISVWQYAVPLRAYFLFLFLLVQRRLSPVQKRDVLRNNFLSCVIISIPIILIIMLIRFSLSLRRTRKEVENQRILKMHGMWNH